MIKVIFVALFTSVIALGIYLFFYLGVYKTPEVGQIETRSIRMLYKEHTGAYHFINSVIHEVEVWTVENHVACDRTFGEYLDDPSAVDQDRLRSHGGCLVTGKPTKMPADFHYEERPAHKYVIARFSGSPSIGPFKVYPKVREYLEAQHLKSSQPVIEIYTIHGNGLETEFLFPLD